MKVTIPNNLQPGDSFTVKSSSNSMLIVQVPAGSKGGDEIKIAIPGTEVIPAQIIDHKADSESTNKNESTSSESISDTQVVWKKSTAGATILGGILGSLIFGPIGGLIVAGGAFYVANKNNGPVGRETRKLGVVTYNCMERATSCITRNFNEMEERNSN